MKISETQQDMFNALFKAFSYSFASSAFWIQVMQAESKKQPKKMQQQHQLQSLFVINSLFLYTVHYYCEITSDLLLWKTVFLPQINNSRETTNQIKQVKKIYCLLMHDTVPWQTYRWWFEVIACWSDVSFPDHKINFEVMLSSWDC